MATLLTLLTTFFLQQWAYAEVVNMAAALLHGARGESCKEGLNSPMQAVLLRCMCPQADCSCFVLAVSKEEKRACRGLSIIKPFHSRAAACVMMECRALQSQSVLMQLQVADAGPGCLPGLQRYGALTV